MIEEVRLSAGFRNDAFQSWRVSDSLLAGSAQRLLPGVLYQAPCEAVDFLRANAVARHNALYPLEKSIAVLTKESKSVGLWELKFDEAGEWADEWTPVAKCIPIPAPREQIGLPPSLVEARADCLTSRGRVLLLSLGKGDLTLLDGSRPGLVHTGWPLASIDGKGFVPFSLLSGWIEQTGEVICIVSAVVDRSCETWTFSVTTSGGGLEVCAPEQLQVDSEPPYFARACLNGDSIVLAGSPVQPESRSERKGLGARDPDASSCPPEQWADVYNESGPDDIGGMGQEPPCVISHYKRNLNGQGYRKVKDVHCHPHGYLGQCPSSSQFPLLGLADDVEMAILETELGSSSELQVTHSASVPAFAYVASGKPQRKYLFVGLSESPVSAVLAESQRIIYVYGKTQATDAHGKFQVLDIQNYVAEADICGAHLTTHTSTTQVLCIVTKSALVLFRF